MKKYIVFLILPLILIFSGCGVDKLTLLNKQIVERRDSFFMAENENYYVTFVSGVREEPYLADGKIGELVPFGIVSFQGKTNQKFGTEVINYYLLMDGIEFEGELEKSAFNNSYSADIEKFAISTNSISIRLFYGAFEYQAEMTCVSKDFEITQKKAMEIACDKLVTPINQMISKKSLNAEVYVKIWKDFSGEDKNFFWYIGIVGANKTAGILISARTGEILSIKQ